MPSSRNPDLIANRPGWLVPACTGPCSWLPTTQAGSHRHTARQAQSSWTVLPGLPSGLSLFVIRKPS
ncbi:hypothetical protein F7R20_25435 [Pseudomonas brassicacearum subsp. brassicacearum]|uniref:Uncharacterized protein n=1 Tax=Pseudomonas ogarae (strain DSM 112162 / CECT 30235 / F113) TaxID=1114970 RepID=A0ABN5G867_PSEO1|nr:hypothetical protein C1C98_13720 [Pseudomonas ogarae]KAB0522182.1 hypothetical protein F7R20_25435 [Pseudomonas brassicacearum subsp. brassicacearum]PJH85915.1 hypothetical protein CVG87_27340 [Pseudomonas sp. WCS365]QEO78631.1 hypothetical protein ELZ14_14060 [Pseudomonas brassicacearum]